MIRKIIDNLLNFCYWWEIQQRINSANICLFALKPVFNSKFVSFKTKNYTVQIICPIILYMNYYKNKWVKSSYFREEGAKKEKIFGIKKDRSIGLWEWRTNLKLRELFSEADIVAMLKSKCISWAGHIWKLQNQRTRETTKWIPNRKRSLRS